MTLQVDGQELTLGIALSGGGYRATLFGLGSLWRLNDAGLLGRLDRITSVSGGSILAGLLATRWHELEFADGHSSRFAELVDAPLRAFCARSIDWRSALKGWLTPFRSPADYLADCYRRELLGSITLAELPNARARGNPKFIFYATNLQTGRSFRFRQDMLADWMLGTSRRTQGIELATAVAASSAFPPVFSPISLKTDPADWEDGAALAQLQPLRRRILLADGGIYDNMGLEALVDNVDISLVSDAGAPFEVKAGVGRDPLRQLGRVRDILIDQTRALRKRALIEDYLAERKRGAYWGVDTQIGDYALPRALTHDSAATRELARVATRLAALDEETQGRLVNWGYALADAALRKRAGLALAPTGGWPAPKWAP